VALELILEREQEESMNWNSYHNYFRIQRIKMSEKKIARLTVA